MEQGPLAIALLHNARETARVVHTHGVAVAGHNGPYRHLETPVRNSAHWAVTFGFLHTRDESPVWRQPLETVARYMQSEDVRPKGFTFLHRPQAGQDRCNGLIGPAWTFEGLCAAAEALEDDKPARLAEEVFLLHPFDDRLGLWHRVEIDGSDLGFDDTFNHQLWFAATAAEITGGDQHELIRARVLRFLDTLPENLKVLGDGLIHHFVNRDRDIMGPEKAPVSPMGLKRRLGKTIRRVRSRYGDRRKTLDSRKRLKWVGYQSFNLYALAMLKQHFPEHPFWESNEIERAVAFMRSEQCRSELEDPDNAYSYAYNAPGFEVPYALAVLGGLDKTEWKQEREFWERRQMELTYDPANARFSRNTADPVTLTARLYECTRLWALLDGTKTVNASVEERVS